jgi:hypothetical protein
MTSPEAPPDQRLRLAAPEASVTQPVPAGGGEKIDRSVCLASQMVHVVCLADEVQVAQRSAPGAPVWRLVTVIQKLAGRPR